MLLDNLEAGVAKECDGFAEEEEVMVVFIHIHLCRKTTGYSVNQKSLMQLNHRNLSTHLQGKVLAKQVNFVSRHLHSNCIGSECASAWKSFFSFNHILWTGINVFSWRIII